MQVPYACCCGLDMQKKLMVACLTTVDSAGGRRKETRTYTTMTWGHLGRG